MYKLLSDGNPKVDKNVELGYLTGALHLAPARESGFEVCPGRSAGCTEACLHTAGNPAYMKAKQTARVRRTVMFFKERDKFLELLRKDIQKLTKKAAEAGLKPAVRLNATSDIRWELYGIVEEFPEVQFYDYTKISNRRNLPPNYHLTFSLSEDNDKKAVEAIRNGMNVAVVFDTPKGKPLPKEWCLEGISLPVFDGDISDFRPSDPPKHFVGLRAKGKGKKDSTGFVRVVYSIS